MQRGKSHRIKNEILEFRLLMKSVPPLIVISFVLSVVSMNLLANKSLALPFDWLALDCGIIVSWFSFLAMDIITRHFGPKAASEISILAVFFNLLFCLMFFIGSNLPGVWSKSYVSGSEDAINAALDATFGGTWYILLGSTIAFILSALINNFSNAAIGRILHRVHDGFGVYAARSYISTAIGQFADNLIFALIVSHTFFGWSILQCITCALTGMIIELLCEVIFSGFGYRICVRWQERNVGKDYFVYTKKSNGMEAI